MKRLTRRDFLTASAATGAASILACGAEESTPRDRTLPELGPDNIRWGDLHTHTELSDGNGTAEENFRIAASHLDFWCMADHACDPEVFTLDNRDKGRKQLNYHWDEVRQLCREFENPGEFIPLLGYEWTNFQYGHHNVYYLDYDQPIRMPATLPELYESLRGIEALAIPHHTAYPVGICGKDWSYHDERLSPFVELYSMHGSSEEPGGIRPLLTGGSWMGPGATGGSIQDGLALGHKFGISASSDSHGGHPGAYDIGLMGVHAEDLSREALWRAFRARRVYGVTGDRIALDFAVNGIPMGSVAPAAGQREIGIAATGWDSFERVEVVKNNRVLHTFTEPAGAAGSGGARQRIRFFVEWGWDNMADHEWNGKLTVADGRILQARPCFRGRASLRLGRGVTALSDRECAWTSTTQRVRGGRLIRSYGQAMFFEVEAAPASPVRIELACDDFRRSLTLTPERMLEKSTVSYMVDIPPVNDGAYWHVMKTHAKLRVHQARLTGSLTLGLALTDDMPEHPGGRDDFYYVRAVQKNGQRAWSSPIWVGS